MGDNHQDIEEPDEGKAFMSGFGDQQVERSACQGKRKKNEDIMCYEGE